MIKRIVLSILCIGGLTACSSTKETLGLNKQVPDEFKVVKRAPLSLPPDYVLRPPSPGAPRPQEQSTSSAAAQTIFGQAPAENVAPTSGEEALLTLAGGNAADPDIRRRVDNETASLVDKNQPVAKKIMSKLTNSDGASASVVNASAEAKRLEENAQEGKPVTDGETPSVIQ